MTLLQALKTIPDNRGKHGRMYDLAHIILFVILATTCGAIGYSNIHLFIKTKFKVLKDIFKLNWKTCPTRSTIHKIISEVDPEDMEKAFRLFSKSLNHKISEKKNKKAGKKNNKVSNDDCNPSNNRKIITVAIDGKVLKSSYNSKNGKGANNLVSAMDSNNLIILAHIEGDDKQSEINKLRELVTGLNKDLGMGKLLVTADAIHSQKKL